MTSKQKIPYEIKNAREWDPKRQGQADSSSEDSESSYEYEFEDWGEGDGASSSSSVQQRTQQSDTPKPTLGNAGKKHEQADDEEGWTTVASTKSKVARPSSQQPSTQGQQGKSTQPAQKAPIRRRVVRQTPPKNRSAVKRMRPFLNFPLDNAAKAAFRRRQPPNARFELHKNAGEVEPDQAKMYDMLAEMGVRFRSFIRPPQE